MLSISHLNDPIFRGFLRKMDCFNQFMNTFMYAIMTLR